MHHPTPVIIVIARADEIRESAYNSGAFAVIPKPFRQSDVLDAIRVALAAGGLRRS